MSYSHEEIIRSFIDSLEKESYSKEELYEALERYLTKIETQKFLEEHADKVIERINRQIMKNTDTSDIPPAGSL